ncbi:MAG: serpin family protein [Haloferacaceae archaeon]
MNRRAVLWQTGALAAAALAGCTGGDSGGNATTTRRSAATDAKVTTATDDGGHERPTVTPHEEVPTGTPTGGDARLAELAAGNASFALDLHRYLARERGGNLFLSPYSVSVALAMTYAGARGDTSEQMRETLHYTLGAEVHPAFADLREALRSRATTEDPVDGDEVDAFELAVANALWGREGYPFAEDFLDLLDSNYGAGLRRADFVGDPAGERERINEWVADATEGRVEDLLPPDAVTPQTVLVLTNAIFFRASWLHEFDPADTEDGRFTALGGAEATVPFMTRELRTNYASVPGAEAVELPYVGDEVSMVLILPDEGQFEAFERDLTSERLFGIFHAMVDAKGTVALPRFEFETEVQLSDALSELGMPAAFTSGANFGGMVGGESGGPWIDEVYHRAVVSVDEEGTEAAASTAVVTVESLPPTWGELRFDRPFLFCIRDKPTDAVLFLGRVADAGSAQAE